MADTSPRGPSLFKTLGIGRDREYVVENLALLITSGMTLIEAIDAVTTDLRSTRMRAIMKEIRAAIEAGSPLWRALDATSVFPAHVVSLIRIGEESGNLSKNLKVVSLQQQKERLFRARIRSAMLYPVFVLGLTVVIGIGIAWFILPKLVTVFAQMRYDLPLITRVLVDIGVFLANNGSVAVPTAVAVLALSVYLLFFFPYTKRVGQALLFVLPGTSRLIREVELARFGYLLGTLLQAGVPVVRAIASVADATAAPQYRKFYRFLEKSVEDGNSFGQSFSAYRHLNRLMPTPVQQLIISGERSGNLSNSLLEVSRDYEEKSETTTKDLSTILEPVLLVIVWLGVVSVALAVILPIYNLVGQLNSP